MDLEKKIFLILEQLEKKNGTGVLHEILDDLNLKYTSEDCHEYSTLLNNYLNSNVLTAKHFYSISISQKGKHYINNYKKNKKKKKEEEDLENELKKTSIDRNKTQITYIPKQIELMYENLGLKYWTTIMAFASIIISIIALSRGC